MKKPIIHSHIAIRSFICVLVSEHIIYLIFLWITYNMTFSSWTVFSHIIWFDIHHIVCIWYVIYLSGDISSLQIITFINANRYMWKVQISTNVEGFNCPILGKKVLQKSSKKLGEFPPYSYSHLVHFDILPILGIWNIITISGDLSDWQIITSIHIYCTA